MNTGRTVESIAMEALRIYLPRGATILPDSMLIQDLGLSSDDATQLALDLEVKLGVRIPRDRW